MTGRALSVNFERLWLTAVWWVWGLGLFVGLIVLSMQPAIFGSDTDKAWQWFLPNILPTLTMVGAAAYALPKELKPRSAPTAVVFAFALGSSILYLLALSISMVAAAFFQPNPLAALAQSSLWLAPLQGFSSSGLAFYFVKQT